MREELTAPAMSETLSGPARRHVLSRGWGLYLLVVAVLVAFVPENKSQIVLVDLLNAAALIVFLGAVIVYRVPLRFYFPLPVLLIGVGSVFAVTNSYSPVVAFVALVKDLYLYLWFLALVALLRPRGDSRGVRLAWMWMVVLTSLFVVVHTVSSGHFAPGDLFDRERGRTVGTFYNPNMFSDYLMMSIFIALGFAEQIRWRLLVPFLVLITLALLTTKSNGGLISLCVGLLAWALAWASARGVSKVRLAGVLVLSLTVALLAGWLPGELGVEISLRRSGGVHGLAAAVSKSHQQRDRIWRRLESEWMKTPMGLGPEGSAGRSLPIGEADRTGDSNHFLSAEAHDDYLAYLVERGPLGLAGLLLCTAQVFAMTLGSRRRLNRLLGGYRAGGALWAAFIGALVGTSIHSLVGEKLHYRHFWMFMAILTAMTAEDASPDRETAAPVPRRATEAAGVAGAAPALRS